MPEKTFDVKYQGTFGKNYRYYEEFVVDGKTVRVTFDRETGIAKNVPEQIALRLARSEAFVTVDSTRTAPEKNDVVLAESGASPRKGAKKQV